MGDTGEQKHSEAAKKAAARHIQDHLAPETHKAGVHADEETDRVSGGTAGELRRWEIHSGLKHRQGSWEGHLRQLEARLQQEQAGLQQANRLIQDNDFATGNNLTGTGSPVVPGPTTGTPPYRSRIDTI